MADYTTEMLYRLCSQDLHGLYAKNAKKFDWIASRCDEDTISRPTFSAALTHYQKSGRTPGSIDALIKYVVINPDGVAEFEKTEAIEQDLRGLLNYEPDNSLDDNLLLDALFSDTRKKWDVHIYKTAASISIGARPSPDKYKAIGPDAATRWLRSELSKLDVNFDEEAEDIQSVDTSKLIHLGSTRDEDNWTFNLNVQPLSAIEMEEMKWLWPNRIPAGKLTIISGKTDAGKSVCLVDFASRVSAGSDWPDGEKNVYGPRKVLFASSEDDPNDTLAPRFTAAGANFDNVLIPRLTMRSPESDSEHNANLNLKRDLTTLVKAIKANPDIALLVLDPITSYLGDININKDEEVRPLFDRLIQLAAKTGITILGLVHSSKRSDVDAAQKIMGASSVSAAARAAWTFSRDSEDKELYRMALAKGNVLKKKTGFEYRIVDAEVEIRGKKTTHPKIQWGKETDVDANDLLQAERAKARENRDDRASNIAIAVLRETVPGFAADVFKKAEQEGVAQATLYRAKNKLNIESDKSGGRSWWYFPGEKGDPALKPVIVETYIPEEVAV